MSPMRNSSASTTLILGSIMPIHVFSQDTRLQVLDVLANELGAERHELHAQTPLNRASELVNFDNPISITHDYTEVHPRPLA